jgi:hypothetical protein
LHRPVNQNLQEDIHNFSLSNGMNLPLRSFLLLAASWSPLLGNRQEEQGNFDSPPGFFLCISYY